MELKELKVFIVGNTHPGWGGKYFVFVKLTTNNGFVGYGEVYSASISPEKMTYVIEDIFERHMKGENPENIELMFRRVYSSGFTQRPDPTIIGAFSGLEEIIKSKKSLRSISSFLFHRVNNLFQ